jgi:drug/metabolite transporter (DMT)-like permease
MGNPFDIPKIEMEIIRSYVWPNHNSAFVWTAVDFRFCRALPMSMLYVANVAFGLVGLSMVNVPMFFCLRRLVAPMIMIYEFLVLGKSTDPQIQGAVGFIVLGTIMAGWDSLRNELAGYVITLLNNVCSAACSVMVGYSSACSSASHLCIHAEPFAAKAV